MRRSPAAILAVFGATAVGAGAGCGGTTTIGGSACPARAVRTCACPNGESGVSRCDADTGTWGDCECAGAEGSGGAAGGECLAGAQACPCRDDGTCDAGLVCADDRCLTAGSAGSASGGAGTGGAAADCDEILGADEFCTVVPVDLLRNQVLLVVDRSGSMGERPAGYATTKWEAVRTALGQVLPEVQGVISAGLELFPTTATTGDPIPSSCAPVDRCCEMPADTELNVPMGVGTTTIPTILEALQASGPAGGTPTAAALARAYDYFRTEDSAGLVGERYVLLVTDGAPMCNDALSCDATTCVLNLEGLDGCTVDGRNCCEPTPIACLDDATTIDQIAALRAIGVRTIVVGLPGTERYASSFEQFAAAGDFERPDGSTGYYAPPGERELVETLGDVIRQLTLVCLVVFPYAIPNLNEVNLAVDCAIIPYTGGMTSYVDGWWFVEPYSSQPLHGNIAGPICDRIQTEGVRRIDAVMSCSPLELE